jgi:hypothetical protein
MKAFERIFLYSALAILFFYVFLVDGNVESQVAIQEEIRARSIEIVNDEGRSVVMLWANENGGMINIANKKGDLTFLVSIGADKNGNGEINIANKDGTSVAGMEVNISEGGTMGVTNESGTSVANMIAKEYGGVMGVTNKDGIPVVIMVANINDNGEISVFNKNSKVIGSLP